MASLKEIATELSKTMRCNCDLDNWQPEESTGHSWVCRIHKAAMWEWNKLTDDGLHTGRVALSQSGLPEKRKQE
jgi:hypothetical protein